jgi:hypothetical protein
MLNKLEHKQMVMLSSEYPGWYANQWGCAVDFAAVELGPYRVEAINKANNTYTLHRNGLVLLDVPRYLIIAWDNR